MDKETLLQYLQPEIEIINATMMREFISIKSTFLAKVIDHAVMGGGKRIRPILTILSGRLVADTRTPPGLPKRQI